MRAHRNSSIIALILSGATVFNAAASHSQILNNPAPHPKQTDRAVTARATQRGRLRSGAWKATAAAGAIGGAYMSSRINAGSFEERDRTLRPAP